MNSGPPRVALFTDSFHEVNGVALTSRQLDAFARRRGFPFFSVHAGPETSLRTEGAQTTYELRRGRTAIRVEQDLYVDPLLLLRQRVLVRDALRKFKPDLVHVTGPNDIGVMGALLSRDLRVPMTASWHTNVHEYAAWRLRKGLGFLPETWTTALGRSVENKLLSAFTLQYRFANACFAPNPELIEMLRARTGKPVHVMHRGVEIDKFRPDKRDRGDGVFQLGYVGRISTEKNIRFLKRLEDGLLATGAKNFQIVVVGHGSEQEWLEQNLSHGVFPGVLQGEALTRAYANFDLFVFPSFTDTYGNVINEAMASGVPCIVTAGGGPKYLIKDGETGITARDEAHFIEATAALIADPNRHARMRGAARDHAVANSWDRVFDKLYEQYAEVARAGR